jgi:hypothetical protein
MLPPYGCFLVDFLDLLKINFVAKFSKTEIFKKLHINLFYAYNKIKREKYLKGSLFLKFFDIYSNNPGICSQNFAAEVTKLWTPDEIRRFDGMRYEKY